MRPWSFAHDLYVLRHGETEWNRAERMQGWLDSPLTPLGRAQAAAQGRILRRLGLPPETRLLTSSAGRCRQTAAILREAAPDLPLAAADDRLREVGLGAWQGLTLGEIGRRWPGFDRAGFFWRFDAPGGETLAAMRARLLAVLAELCGPAVVVTHGVASKLLRGLALGLGDAETAALPGGQGLVHRLGPQGQAALTDPALAPGAPPAL